MASKQHVLINGVGLAGLALAIALAKRKIASTLFEIRAEPRTIGGAIALAPNALRVLDKIIGVGDTVRGAGYEYNDIQLMSDDGLQIGTVINGGKEKFGYPAVRVNRSAVHGALVECAKSYPNFIKIHWDVTIGKIHESQRGVTVALKDGQTMEGSLVVGADGIHSKVREHVLGNDSPTPQYSGLFGVGGLVNHSDIEWGSCRPPAMIFSRHGTLLAIPTDPEGKQIGWAIQRTVSEKTRDGWDDYIASGEALNDCRNHFGENPPQPIRDIMSKTKPESMRGWPPYSIPDLPTWHKGRVVLIGDAAHAIPPHAGQGAAQAFEDAGLLARLLSEPDGLKNGYEGALTHFELVRKERFAKVRKVTEASGNTRGSSTSAVGWMAKKYAMWLYFQIYGTRLGSEEMFNYDVNEEALS